MVAVGYKPLRFAKPVNFYPGAGEWFTFNVYSGVNLLDHLLRKIYGGVDHLLSTGTLKSFFFVRYRDPDFHLRLRFRLNHPKDLGAVTGFLFDSFKPYLLENIIWKTTITGYTREMLRYGILNIELVEDIFAKSSLMTLKNMGKPRDRWGLGVIYLNVVFDLMDFRIRERAFFCNRAKKSFFDEFNFDKQVKSVLRTKFSAYYDQIDRTVQDRGSFPACLDFKNTLSESFEKLKGLLILHHSSEVDLVLTSVVHMEFNRIFVDAGREKEAIIYYMMDRYYTKQLNQKTGEGKRS